MEIERKFLIPSLPEDLDQYPHKTFQQGYLCTSPVVRIRQEGDCYVLTYKSGGMLAREEYNLPLTKDAYHHLLPKIDGILISKERYFIPLTDSLTIELDVFHEPYQNLVLAEVEFSSKEEALSFTPPDWFGTDVTFCPEYHNSYLSQPHDSK